jgi:hypothetical protein
MNVCLVSAPVATDFKTRDEIDSCLGEPAVSEPQLGILSLAAVLEARRDKVSIIDLDQAYLANLDSPDEAFSFAEHAAQLMVAEPADVYGFSSICSSYPLTVRIAKAVKAARPGSVVLFGGPQASVVDRQTLEAFSFVDFVLRGEAEVTLPALLDELASEGQLARVPSLTYRCRSELSRNAAAPIIEDLDILPSPAYHLTGGLQGATKASLELGRGCPYACTFCSTNDFFRRRFRLRSPERVIRDMRQIASTYHIRQFELVHDMFTVDRRRVVSFCEAMLAAGDGFEWSCSARTDSVDEELLELMARAGCVGVFYGVESGSQRLQKIFEKDLDVERARLVVAATERLGMRSTVSLITGFPEETENDLRQTLRMFIFSACHAQSTPHLNILAPLAATPIYLKYRDQMILGDLCSDISQQGPVQDPEDWTLIEQHAEIFPNFYLLPTPHLDRDRLLELREFALNGVGHFRWLLCAIHQGSYPVYDLFLLWQKHRREIKPFQKGAELKRYYNSSHFRRDFLSFIQSRLPDHKTVRALLEFEAAWSSSSNTFAHQATATETVADGAAACVTDFPVCSPGLNFIELSFDIQSIINALKHEIEPAWELGTYHYITPELSDPLKRLYRISRELGQLLRLCNGQQDIGAIVEALAPEFSEVAGAQRNAAVLGLIQAAAQGGLLSIHCGPIPLRCVHLAA